MRMARSAWVLFTMMAAVVSSARADDWPQWGGPQRDGIWREKGIVANLPAVEESTGMLPRAWSAKIGSGYAGPAVAGGSVFVTDRVGEEPRERVYCFDANTGQELWKHEYEARYSISYPLGPRATPTVDGDRVYVLGAVGHLFCFEAASGKILWQKYYPTDFGAEIPQWGTASAPLVEGDQLILLAGGKPGAMVVSLNKMTGEEMWRALEGPEPGYCPPIVLEFGGRRQLIVWHSQAIVGLDPARGKTLWQVPFAVRDGLTISMPRKFDQRLFLTNFYQGPLMINLGPDGISPHVEWRTSASSTEMKNDSLHAIMCTPVFTKDCVFGVGSYGEMRGLDPESGHVLWETLKATGPGRWWNAFLVPHENRIVVCNEQGELIFARIGRGGYEELSRAKLIEPTQPIGRRMTVWSHPAFAMQSVFARNDGELIRVNLAK